MLLVAIIPLKYSFSQLFAFFFPRCFFFFPPFVSKAWQVADKKLIVCCIAASGTAVDTSICCLLYAHI